MAESLTIQEIEKTLRERDTPISNGFDLLQSFSKLLYRTDEVKIQELFLRLLERRNEFVNLEPIINSIAKELGLFPYMDNQGQFSLQEALQYEYHRPKGLPDEIIFHQIQARVYFKLLSGKNIILSAPTSFGKSLIIDAIIASNAYQNIAIIVPTIALIDETRRRLSKYSNHYKLITHGSQEPESKNVFILTQERALEFLDPSRIDFFVIDEFYKIQPADEDDDRSYLLNQIFYRLLKHGAQFYLLGPNIENVNLSAFPNPSSIEFIRTDFQTVISELHRVFVKNGNEIQALIELCKSLSDPTLIYCQSPASAVRITRALLGADFLAKNQEIGEGVAWMRANYHPKWLFPEAYSRGIGIHHGRIPRALSQLMVREFNNGNISFLICTSTLIEGVNTKAKNVIIYDKNVSTKPFDFFTFNNIKGRSGRMFEHFIGNVYLFHEPPLAELPLVDFPILSQPDDAPESMLLQVDNEDLSPRSKKRLEEVQNQLFLSIEVLKMNQSVKIEDQIALAKEIARFPKKYSRILSWTRYPTYQQLLDACNLVWKFFVGRGTDGVRSPKQLAWMLFQLQLEKDISKFIRKIVDREKDIEKQETQVDMSIDFLKQWIEFKMPRFLMALSSIQQEVLTSANLPFGNFSYYSRQMECLFTDKTLLDLEEYGIPLQVSQKIRYLLQPEGNLDPVLERLRILSRNQTNLSKFEWSFVEDVKGYV